MASYLGSTRDFFYRRRKPFLVVGGLVGGAYWAANYAVSKLSDMQRRMVEERRDKDNLRRRFARNQEDCTYTVLALLPTLGDQLFAHMDVEGLTAKLQRGKQTLAEADSSSIHTSTKLEVPSSDSPKGMLGTSVNGHAMASIQELDASTNSLNVPSNAADSTLELQEDLHKDTSQNAMEEVWKKLGSENNGQQAIPSEIAQSEATENPATSPSESLNPADVGSAKIIQINGSHDDSKDSSLSNLDKVSEPAPLPIPPQARLTPSPRPSPPAEIHEGVPRGASPLLQPPIIPDAAPEASVQNVGLGNGDAIGQAESVGSSSKTAANSILSPEDALAEKRTKLKLWNELKIAAFARTITTLYGVVLLSLQTHVQLNLLGRYAYLTSVSSLSDSASSHHQIRLERHDGQLDLDDDRSDLNGEFDGASSVRQMKGIDMQTERLYLTLSWWFLHRGWRQLADLVQEAVEDVFGDVALKAPVTHAEFLTLLRKVRRRVEYEGRVAGVGSGVSGYADGENSYLNASMASVDARSEWSEATTAATRGGRRRGQRRNFASILFPPPMQEVHTLIEAGALPHIGAMSPIAPSLSEVSPILPGLLDETRDIIESDDFWRVMKLGLRKVFGVFEDTLRPAFGLGPAPPRTEAGIPAEGAAAAAAGPPASVPPPPPSMLSSVGSLGPGDASTGKAVRLASLFPTVARQSTAAINGIPNEYVDALSSVKELRAFCAVIYSAWS